MNKTVVYSRRENRGIPLGGDLLSVAATAKRLRISRVTVLRWIYDGLLWPKTSQPIGNDTFHLFLPEYIDEVDKVLPRNRGDSGKMLLDADRKQRLKRLAQFWKNRDS